MHSMVLDGGDEWLAFPQVPVGGSGAFLDASLWIREKSLPSTRNRTRILGSSSP
jgi:hypothetical protein